MAGNQSTSAPLSESQFMRVFTVEQTQKRKREPLVSAACDSCRVRKTRCDGVRPVCGKCIAKGIECVYDVAPGETRSTSLKQRYTALAEKHKQTLDLVAQLPNASNEEVYQQPLPVKRQRASVSSPSTSISTSGSKQESSVERDESRAERSTTRDTSLSEGSNENLATSTSMQMKLPDRDTFTIAASVYTKSVGPLFYVYTDEQIEELVNDAFELEDDSARNPLLCQLCAIAALGSFYSSQPRLINLREHFYILAKYYLDDLIQKEPLRSIKACAILGLLHIVTKSTVALVYFDMGLSIARSSGLHWRTPPPNIPHDIWIDYKRVWRTLVHANGWIRSTLGILSNLKWKEDYEALKHLSVHDGASINDIVQTEMAKISSLKADMLTTITTCKTLSPRVLASIRTDLQAWQTGLPEVMSITHLFDADLEKHHKHKIYFVHLLYLGACMLLQRSIVSQWAVGVEYPSTSDLSTEALEFISDGYTAAKQSSRLLGLLSEGDGAVKRCWICIFQSYISALLLIQESIQKILHRTASQKVLEEDMVLIDNSLDVLKLCATDDIVAQRLSGSLAIYYDSLQSIIKTGLDSYMNDLYGFPPEHQKPPSAHLDVSSLDLIVVSDGDTALHKAAKELFILLCRPFGDMQEPGAIQVIEHSIFREKTHTEDIVPDQRGDEGCCTSDVTGHSPSADPSGTSLAPISTSNPSVPSGNDGPLGWSKTSWGNERIRQQYWPCP
ncbi:hypothetical protein BDV97DRAFT_30132 [Delphinella strobiligena]|nr:hypothetical protein BDV97DRAFT_30132 [Delphinella strobiligena]